MKSMIRLEFFKMRGRYVWLLPLSFLVVQGGWMWWTMKRMSHLDIMQGWQHYLYQLPLLNAILLPILMAVIASRVADVEHKGCMLRQLCVVQPTGGIIAAKLVYGSWYLICLLTGQMATMLLIGLYKGFYGPIPWQYFGYYLLFTFTVTLCIYMVQLFLSLFIRNQAISLIIGMAGGFCGLFSLFLQNHLISRIILWTYYSQLFLCGMNWDKETRVSDMYWVAPNWQAFALLFIGMLLTMFIGWRLFEQKEC